MHLAKTVTVFLPVLLLLSISSNAQKNEDEIKSNNSYFKFQASYLSNDVFYGRKDSLPVPYIIPDISYHDKSGFFIEGSLSYLASQGASQIDAGSLTAGYDFQSTNQKFSGELYASKYFVSQSSSSVRGDVKAATGGTVDYNFGPITLDGGVDTAFSGKTDIAVSFGASHLFEFGQNKDWAINPSFLVSAGTDNFYLSYFTNRKYSLKRKRRAANLNPIKVIVVQNGFSVLDYEFSLPLNYDDKKWGLFFTPTYAAPVNPIQYSLNNGITYRTENLTNSFYAEIGAYIKF